jgi:hypothetical protein
LVNGLLRLYIRQPGELTAGRSGSTDRAAQNHRVKLMKKLVFVVLLIASPAWAQTRLVPKSVTARADPCAPIGRTADGKLVYSMKCDNLPAPPPPPPQAEVAPPPPPEPEVHRSGIFGWSYETKRPDQ